MWLNVVRPRGRERERESVWAQSGWTWGFEFGAGWCGRRLDPHLENFYALWMNDAVTFITNSTYNWHWNTDRIWDEMKLLKYFRFSHSIRYLSLSLSISGSTELNRFEKQSNTHSIHMETATARTATQHSRIVKVIHDGITFAMHSYQVLN